MPFTSAERLCTVEEKNGVRCTMHQSRACDTEPTYEPIVRNEFYDEQAVFTWATRVISGPDRLQSGTLDDAATGPSPSYGSVVEVQDATGVRAITEENIHRLSCASPEQLSDYISTGPRPSPRPSTSSDSSFGTWMPMDEVPPSLQGGCSPESLCKMPFLSRTSSTMSCADTLPSPATSVTTAQLTPTSPNTSSDTVTCYMHPHDRHGRCRKRFVHSDSIVVRDRRVVVKLFIVPGSTKPRAKELCFRSPNAGLKLELRASYAEASHEIEEDLGSMSITFSVEGDTVQEAHHSHFFSLDQSPLCACPFIFNPPAANMAWIVRVKLTPGDDVALPLDQRLSVFDGIARDNS